MWFFGSSPGDLNAPYRHHALIPFLVSPHMSRFHFLFLRWFPSIPRLTLAMERRDSSDSSRRRRRRPNGRPESSRSRALLFVLEAEPDQLCVPA